MKNGFKEKINKEVSFKLWQVLIAAVVLIGVVVTGICFATKDGETDAAVSAEAEPENVFNFNYNEASSKAYIKLGNKKENVTDYVTGYSEGELCMTTEGFEKVFGLKKEEATAEEIADFNKKAEDEGIFIDDSGEYLKLSGDDKTLILQENQSFYLSDGAPGLMNRSVVRKNGELSIPLTYLVFDLGYTRIGTGTEGDSIVYSLSK